MLTVCEDDAEKRDVTIEFQVVQGYIKRLMPLVPDAAQVAEFLKQVMPASQSTENDDVEAYITLKRAPSLALRFEIAVEEPMHTVELCGANVKDIADALHQLSVMDHLPLSFLDISIVEEVSPQPLSALLLAE
jgi:hypothetical protein